MGTYPKCYPHCIIDVFIAIQKFFKYWICEYSISISSIKITVSRGINEFPIISPSFRNMHGSQTENHFVLNISVTTPITISNDSDS